MSDKRQVTPDAPIADLFPGEEWKRLIGNNRRTLGLTNQRVILIVQDSTRFESTVIFLNKIDGVRFSRHAKWGYILAAVLLLVIVGVGGWYGSMALKSSEFGCLAGVLGVLGAIVLFCFFLASRKTSIRILGGNETIETTFERWRMGDIKAFAFDIQAAVVERELGGNQILPGQVEIK